MHYRSRWFSLRRLVLLAGLSLPGFRVLADADIALSLGSTNTTPGIGDVVSITLVVNNGGPDAATGLVIGNQLPLDFEFVGASTPAFNPGTAQWTIGTLDAGAGTTLVIQTRVPYPTPAVPIDFGEVRTDYAGVSAVDQSDPMPDDNIGSLDFSITAHLRTLTVASAHGAPAPAAGTYTNLAGTTLTNSVNSPVVEGGTQYICTGWTLSSGQPPATGGTNRMVMTVYQNATLTWQWVPVETTDVRVAKSVNPSVVTSGADVAFTVVASNAGPRAAYGLLVQDVLPAGLSFVSASSAGYDDASGRWSVGQLAAGATTSLTITATVTTANGTAVTNSASLLSMISIDANPANNSAAAVVVVSAVTAPLTVVSAHGSPTPPAGVSFLPVGMTVDASVPSPVLDGSIRYACTGWTLTAHAPSAGSGNAFSFTLETNATLTWHWETLFAPELDVTKAVDHTTPGYEETITYVVSVTNRGNAMATGVVVTDHLPSGLVWKSSSPGYDRYSGTWPVGALAAGASTTITISAIAPAARDYAVAAMVSNPAPMNSDAFGHAVADAGGALLVGMPGHPSGHPYGQAHLFSAAGVLLQTFTNPAPGSGERFGDAVAGAGGRIAVAAPADPSGSLFGSVYLFDPAGSLLATITNPSPEVLDQFGETLAAVGTNRLLIGASHEPAGANAGAAYLYDLNGVLQVRLTNAAIATGDRFGAALSALDAGRVLVGAPGAPEGAGLGEASLFSTAGTLLAAVTNPTAVAGEEFGAAVAGIDGRYLLVGAAHAPGGAGEGAAHLFNTNGVLLHTFTNPAPATYWRFGATLADLGHGRLAIGAEGGPGGSGAGAVLIYDTAGTLLHVFTNPAGGTNQSFASSMAAVGGRYVAAGAPNFAAAASAQGQAWLFSLAFPDLVGATLTNRAAVALDQSDPLAGNNAAEALVTITLADRLLTVVSAHGPTVPAAGVHTNLSGLKVTNSAPASVLAGSNLYVCTGWSMSGNDPVSGTANVMTMVPTNDAVLTWLWVTNVPADVAVSKSVDDATPGIGDTVTFTLRATNAGFIAATGVNLVDVLPAGLVFAAASSGDYDANTGFWTVGTLAAGAATTITVQATVALPSTNVPVLHGAVLTNTLAVAGVNEVEITATNNLAAAMVTVTVKPRALTIVSAHGAPNPSGVVTNSSGATLTNTVASPVVSGSTQYTCTGWTLSTGEPAAGATNVMTMTQYQDATLTWLWTTNQRIDVALSKTVDEPVRAAGQFAQFRLHVVNNGPHPASGLLVGDLLPTNLLFVSAGSGDYDPNTGVWNIGDLAGGASTSVIVTVQMGGAPYPGGTLTTNRLSLLALDQIDTNAANNSGAAVVARAEPVSFTFDVFTERGTAAPAAGSHSFPGGSVLTNSVTSPLLSGGTQYVCAGWFLSGNEPSSGTSNSFVCTLTNNATLTWLWTTNLGTDVRITKTADNASPASGGLVAYTLVASNRGPNPAAGLVVLDALPAGLTFASVTSADYNPGTGLWTVGDLAAGASTSLTIEAVVSASTGSVLTNVASISALLANDTNAANDASAAVIVAGSSNVLLSIVSPYSAATPSAGDHTNAAGSTVNASVNSPVLVGSTQYVCTGWTLTGNTPATGTSNHFAFVLGRPGALTWLWQETQAPELAVAKSVDNAAPGIGDEVVFTLSVTNQGNATATGVALRDALPAGLAFAGAGGAYNPTTGVWTVGTLAPGASAALALTSRVVATVPQTIVNTAAVFALDQTDVNPANDAATAALTCGATQRLLTIVSAHGDPDRPAGVHLIAAGSTITNSVAPPAPSPGLQYVCIGWTLTGGDEPATGTSNVVVSTMYRDGTLTWLWATNVSTDVALALAMDNPAPVIGQNVTLTLTATNQGPQPASGLVITNRLAGGLAVISSSSTGYVAATRQWYVGTLAPAAATSLTLVVAVSNNLALVGSARTSEIAVASLAVADTEPTNNSAAVIFVPVSPVPLWSLTVVSEHGAPVPAAGVHTNADGSNVLLQVSDQIVGSTQYVCTGWSLTGLSDAIGGDNNTIIVQTNHVVFTWLWTTNYLLQVAPGFGGQASVSNAWIPAGATTSVLATAGDYFTFTNWTGDLAGGSATDNPVTVTMNLPRAIQPVFAPLVTSNGVALWWLAHYGLTNDFEAETDIDHDGDGQTTGQEYIALTDPTNAASFFATRVRTDGSGVIIEWAGVSGRVYSVEAATFTDEFLEWLPVDEWTNVIGTAPFTSVTNLLPGPLQFYRASGRLAPLP